MKGKVLLTGISGFLGSHTAIQLLNNDYHVIGTLRDLKRADSIKKLIGAHTEYTDHLSFAQAELTNEKVWFELTQGVDYVQHIASPFPRELPRHEDELIIPAKKDECALYIASYLQITPQSLSSIRKSAWR